MGDPLCQVRFGARSDYNSPVSGTLVWMLLSTALHRVELLVLTEDRVLQMGKSAYMDSAAA